MSEEKLSPMMQQYKDIKKEYCDAILMFRLGDFYEMFFDDALTASKILDLTLTGRDCGLKERAPMCGVPYHAVENYIARLIEAGYNVAICDQLTLPNEQKGMVKRGVTRLITPGTVIEDGILDGTKNNYIASVYVSKAGYAVAYVDINDGEISAYSKKCADFSSNLENYLQVISPNEIIGNSTFIQLSEEFSSVSARKLKRPKLHYDYAFDKDNAETKIKNQMGVYNLAALGFGNDCELEISAIGGLLDYITTTQMRELSHINRIRILYDDSYMRLDYNTKKSLELTENISDQDKNGSLLWVLDNTGSNLGARLLRRWVEEPLVSEKPIKRRLDAVEEIVKRPSMKAVLVKHLSRVRDIEKIAGKISYGTVNPRECLAIGETLETVAPIKKALSDCKSEYLCELHGELNAMEDLADLISRAIDKEASTVTRDGGFIAKGYNAVLDDLRNKKGSGDKWLKQFEAKEREATGIKNLRVAYNRVFGFYIEVPRSQVDSVPYTYVRRQTTINSERYITEELKKTEEEILGAADKAVALEQTLYDEIKEFLNTKIRLLQQNGSALAQLDALCSLATVAVSRNYVRPKILTNGKIKIIDGRHPVVEAFKKQNEYVPNDCVFDKDNTMLIITGPNMAGKSTYMRQVALITIMAQIGSFVPAKSAEISIVDRVFTRIGASDNLSQGQSTFMVEMTELSAILSSATSDSLLILDEIGRGTSTLDGLSIAWAIIEHLAARVGAKTLFATHYHELTQIEGVIPGVKNFRTLINDTNGKISFLYKIARGGASKSFGIEVAELAGVKKEIISRAKAVMRSLEDTHELSGDLIDKLSQTPSETSVLGMQMGFFEEDKRLAAVERTLKDIDVNRCTPIEALTILSDIKKLLETDK